MEGHGAILLHITAVRGRQRELCSVRCQSGAHHLVGVDKGQPAPRQRRRAGPVGSPSVGLPASEQLVQGFQPTETGSEELP